ncbi:dephospho-CoA kinase [Fretibacter rubidus]|uniref:dephospho-CoA kinase n=1 Tax=Fretibacter rubidus TaxID=570162 RepID=UPI00352B8FF4
MSLAAADKHRSAPIIIGLTGSIGMGKTTTAEMFEDLGCPVFDADAAVHRLYAKGGQAVPLIRAVFPDAVNDGAVDRAILGKYMREDPLQLTVLESFIHPMVTDMRSQFLQRAKASAADIVVFDIPLLFETGGDVLVDKVVVVTAPAHVQRERVMAREGMTEDLFKMILSRQLPDAQKRIRADYTIFTHRGLEEAREQVQDILTDLRQNGINREPS